MNKGLSSKEVQERREKYGRNELTGKKKKTIWQTILEQFASPLLILLMIASVISFVTGEPMDGAFIALVVVINCVIGTIQEVSAEKSVEKLKQMTSSMALVIRDGKTMDIPSSELVVGDYVLLEAGRVVPADLKLLETSSLKINESALTGESVAAEKDSSFKSDDTTPLGDRKDQAFMSTLIEYGRGEGVVKGVGDNTEIGKISKMLNDITKEETPLQKNLNQISMVLGFFGIGLCLLMLGLQIFAYHRPFLETLMIAIAFAVAVIPEGLATVVTIVLSRGIKKMSEKNAIVKQIHAVETLGAVNVICTDKTGTLTQNKMTVVKWFYNGEIKELEQTENNDKLFIELLTGFCACNDATYDGKEGTGDPTEIAFLKYAKDNRLNHEVLVSGIPRFDELPFDSDRKMMTTLHHRGEGTVSYTKGAIDSVITRCTKILDKNGVRPIKNDDVVKATTAAEQMSSDALRVLALAYRENDETPSEDDMIFIGLAAMIDPPKEGVKETIKECHDAGIEVAMITGDHKITAFAIAKELDIAHDLSQCITGAEIDEMDPEDFNKNVLNYRVFARVSPEHKVQIVNAFKSHDKIVSMTGDGVNDSPSLKAANIGVAMGIGGTEVAKDAAEMILVDDNFITIKNAVMEGRNLFNNIKKSILYLLRANFGEMILMLAAVLVGFASPLSTIQILWVNLMTDTVPSLALGMDKSTNDVMKENPRDVKKGILNKGDYLSIIVQGVICGFTALIGFLYPALQMVGIENVMSAISNNPELLSLCRTYCFSVLVVNEILMAYVCKSKTELAFFGKNSWNNKLLNISTVVGLLLQIAVITFPPLTALLGLTTCGVGDIMTIFIIAIIGVMINAAITLAKERLSIKKEKDI